MHVAPQFVMQRKGQITYKMKQRPVPGDLEQQDILQDSAKKLEQRQLQYPTLTDVHVEELSQLDGMDVSGLDASLAHALGTATCANMARSEVLSSLRRPMLRHPLMPDIERSGVSKNYISMAAIREQPALHAASTHAVQAEVVHEDRVPPHQQRRTAAQPQQPGVDGLPPQFVAGCNNQIKASAKQQRTADPQVPDEGADRAVAVAAEGQDQHRRQRTGEAKKNKPVPAERFTNTAHLRIFLSGGHARVRLCIHIVLYRIFTMSGLMPSLEESPSARIVMGRWTSH